MNMEANYIVVTYTRKIMKNKRATKPTFQVFSNGPLDKARAQDLADALRARLGPLYIVRAVKVESYSEYVNQGAWLVGDN